MLLRRHPVTQSLTSRLSCSWPLVLRWCAVASRPSMASWRNGLPGSPPSLSRPAAKSSLCQNVWAERAFFLNFTMSSALRAMTIHVASDMPSSSRATKRVTKSPWVQTLAMPNCDSMKLTPENYSSTKLIGTRFHMASGAPLRFPGTKRQRITASTAWRSRRS